MLQFKSPDDLQQLKPSNPSYPVIADLVQRLIVDYAADGFTYDPDADGWVVLWEEADGNRPVTEIWNEDTRLTDLLWEGWTKQDGHFIGIFLANNQWGLCVVVPDEPWIHPDLCLSIAENLDPPLPAPKCAS